MSEKGRRDSSIGTNRDWLELLAVKTNPEIKYQDAAEVMCI
jgi:hypothetical protein